MIRVTRREGREIAIAPAAANGREQPDNGREGQREPGGDTKPLTPEQRAIVEHGDGPMVVIAGAGTGKTRVIVERVAHLLETQRDLLPEQLLVLTYNVKAARELRERIQARVGAATASRMTISNYHAFCNAVLQENASEADMPPHPDVLDGIGQYLLIRDIRPTLDLVYHGAWAYGDMVRFINRAKDELVSPADFEAWVAKERKAFEDQYGPYTDAANRLATSGNLKPIRAVRSAYARLRTLERQPDAPDDELKKADAAVGKEADKQARVAVGGIGQALGITKFDEEQQAEISELAATYVVDGAALEVMRLTELAQVYRAYEEELVHRGALDFGEQIAAVTRLFKVRPNILRRYQRQYRHVLVDEFQDANIAQIELIEMIGRCPDRPDNVMVVGDDDQSIYRFRGASYAAFAEFDKRFCRPPTHDPDATPPGPPSRFRIERNFRSGGHVLSAANRLITHNQLRFEPDKRLSTDRDNGVQVQVVVCAGTEDEAVAIVDAIRARVGASGAWSDVAVLYRKHKHRDAIVKRLEAEDIPYTVVGGLSLFATPEIRDLEQSLRATVDPTDGPALVRMMTAGPWRLDAFEVLRVTRTARFDPRRSLIDVVRDLVTTGEMTETVPGVEDEEAAQEVFAIGLGTRAKLRRMLATLEELSPLTWREGPHTILERFVELTGQVLDLVAAGTAEAHRAVANIGSFLRFAADWQAAHPDGSLGGFVDYLDVYQEAGGELPTSVELTEDLAGVRLMTLYQAKGLEFPHVVIPQLLENEWPTKEGWSGFFPDELLREPISGEGLHTEEERRLLYVAMTRAQETLMLTTHGGPMAEKAASLFVNEVAAGQGMDVELIDRANSWTVPEVPAAQTSGALTLARRVIAMPSAHERRLDLRRRAAELIGLLEGTDAADPEAEGARAALEAELAEVGERAAISADEARAKGLDPVTLRELAGDSAMGAKLLDVVPAPGRFSYSSFDTYERCPLQYAFKYVYRIPEPAEPVAAFSFGTTAHAAFEAFTKERRERIARGEPLPTREDLERFFQEHWVPQEFGDRTTEEAYTRRVDTLLDNFWTGEVANLGEAIAEEEPFALLIEDPAGGAPVVMGGDIDRIDRLPSGGIEVIDYKTGKVTSQKSVHESLQLSIYALACRDALGLGTPEKVTLYFTESATRMSSTRTDDALDAARADILARASRIRSGDFGATPSDKTCGRCEFARLCPSRR